MKNLFVFLVLGTLSLTAFGADSGINPGYLKLKVYKVAVSASELCTNPKTLCEIDTADATYQDFLGAPTICNGALDNGTYPCVIIEFSDNIKYTSTENSTSGNCAVGTEYTMDVCNNGSPAYQLIDGTSGTCTSAEERVAMYLSTTSTTVGSGNNTNAFIPPSSTNNSTEGFNLANPLVVNKTTSSTFVVNGAGQIEDSNSQCDMQPPAFSFE